MPAPKLTQKDVEEAICPIQDFARTYHGAALALVGSGLLPGVS
jgi:hypothetical protein